MSGDDRGRRAQVLLRALDQRVAQAAAVLLAEHGRSVPTSDPDRPGDAAATLLPVLLDLAQQRPGPELWLASVAVSGSFPLAGELEETARLLELGSAESVVQRLLDRVFRHHHTGRPDLEMDIVIDRVVIDADFCARADKHTGIQRVVRETSKRWLAEHLVVGAAHTDERSAYRALAPREHERVFRHGEPVEIDPEVERHFSHRLLVPWRTVVVWGEVPDVGACPRLAAMAQYSGNTVGMVAYDMIPIVSSHLRHIDEGGGFTAFLHPVKQAHRIAGISTSATAEFRGFAQMLTAQGLPGPQVHEIELPEVADHRDLPDHRPPSRPVVVLTGSREPHKNMRGALHAAERLWAEGLDFEVVLIGGRGWDERLLDQTLARLRSAGRPVTTLGWVDDDEMWRRVRAASFVVFASLHEGYGLPIAEALACGTPVITSDFGAQREIAEKGGCVTVDPRDDQQMYAAVRSLLTDPARLAGLRAEIADRPSRTWDDYARDLWGFLVDGVTPEEVRG